MAVHNDRASGGHSCLGHRRHVRDVPGCGMGSDAVFDVVYADSLTLDNKITE